MVAGIGTEVGKTVVSAILAHLFRADYWKPIQCGDLEQTDSFQMKKWLDPKKHLIHNSAYSLQNSLSPHHAARLEGTKIKFIHICPPQTRRPLIIEGVGGILVPLSTNKLTIDLFASWNCHWVLVSKHYLGSINHTLLSLEVLKQRNVSLLGVIFNGASNPDTESAILKISKLPCLGKLVPEDDLSVLTLQNYGKQWRKNFSKIL